MPALLIISLLAAEPAPQVERFDHHGAVGLLLGVHGARKDIGGNNVPFADSGWRAGFDLGGSINVGYSSNEIILVGRVALGGLFESSVYAGYRSYFGQDRFKTMLDLDAAVHITPYVTGGVRFGVGIQYELSSLVGVYTQIAGQIGAGQVLLFKAELVIGFQFRSFLLE